MPLYELYNHFPQQQVAASPYPLYNLLMTLAGELLNGRYELLERIGAGGMAAVYKARDRALGRLVAVKMLHESLTSDEGFLKRFQQEAHAAANLSHPNVVTIHDIGQDGFRHYIIMEYVEGRTLKQIIRAEADEERTLPISRVLDLAIQICRGIGYAHRAGLVHCDVKPQNILITPDEQVKVADFGIARAVSSATQQQFASQVWGTPQYFAPEQASGQAPTPATDVYAIGIVLFEMLSGRLPFTAESHTAMALQHLQKPAPLVTEFNPTVPPQLAQIINKVLAKEPASRYRTAGQLGRILSAYRERSLAETGAAAPVPPAVPDADTLVPVAEQKTQIYQRPSSSSSTAKARPPLAAEISAASETRQPRRDLPADPAAETVHVPSGGPSPDEESDWTAVTLGVAALIALLGLIPLWWFVYLAWAP